MTLNICFWCFENCLDNQINVAVKTVWPHLIRRETPSRVWSGCFPWDRQHRNLSHSLVRNIKSGSWRQAKDVKWVKTRPEATKCKTGAKLEGNLDERPHQQEILLSYAVCNICHAKNTATYTSVNGGSGFLTMFKRHLKLYQIIMALLTVYLCVSVHALHHSSLVNVFSVVYGTIQFHCGT